MTQNTKLDLQKLLRMIEEAVSAEKKDSDRVISYLQECYQLGVKVLPIDINQSDVKCTIDGHEKHLRLGFSAIVSRDEPFIEDIVNERRENGQFQNFQDFCERIPIETIPSSFFTRCVEAGAFDSVEVSRTSLFAGHEHIIQAVQKSVSERSANQISLFDTPAQLRQIPLPETEAWTEEETIEHEKAALGFSFTEYLLHRDEEDGEEPPGTYEQEQIQTPVLESSPPLPPEQFSPEEFEVSFPQGFTADLPPSDKEAEISSKALSTASAPSPSTLILQLTNNTTENDLLQLKDLCERHPGKTHVLLEFSDEDDNKTLMKAHDDYCVAISEKLLQAITMIVGDDRINLLPAKEPQ